MQSWRNLLMVLLVMMGVGSLSFDGLLYNVCQQQKAQIQAMKDKQNVEYEFNTSKFKYQDDQIRSLKEDLENIQAQIKEQEDSLSNQKDVLMQEAQKRQALEDQDKRIIMALSGIKTSADATQEDMKSWQKDYVAVLAQLGTKMDNTQAQIKELDDNIAALDIPQLKADVNALQVGITKLNQSATQLPADTSDQEQKIEHSQMSSP